VQRRVRTPKLLNQLIPEALGQRLEPAGGRSPLGIRVCPSTWTRPEDRWFAVAGCYRLLGLLIENVLHVDFALRAGDVGSLRDGFAIG
jgi:hypothetical protein